MWAIPDMFKHLLFIYKFGATPQQRARSSLFIRDGVVRKLAGVGDPSEEAQVFGVVLGEMFKTRFVSRCSSCDKSVMFSRAGVVECGLV